MPSWLETPFTEAVTTVSQGVFLILKMAVETPAASEKVAEGLRMACDIGEEGIHDVLPIAEIRALQLGEGIGKIEHPTLCGAG